MNIAARLGGCLFALPLVLGSLSVSADQVLVDSDPWLQQLCGLWLSADQSETASYEYWWWQGAELHGEGGRWVDGQRIASEKLRLVFQAEGGYDYWAQPLSQDITMFHAASDSDPQARRWENPGHDFPQLIRYRLDNDHLEAYISRLNDIALEQGQGWHFTRQAACAVDTGGTAD